METFRIDRIGGQGDGIAETPSGPVFASLTLPGETVRGEVRDGRLETVEIVTPSADRIAPVSPQYGDCGGCALQHWAAEPYLDWKREQVRLALARLAVRPAAGLLLVDEPTAHLDPETARQITEALLQIAKGRTLIVATHDAALAARMDRVIALPLLDGDAA